MQNIVECLVCLFACLFVCVCVCVWAFSFQITWLTCLGQVGLQDASAQNSGGSWCAHICGTGGLECSGKIWEDDSHVVSILVGQLGNHSETNDRRRLQECIQQPLCCNLSPGSKETLQLGPLRWSGKGTPWRLQPHVPRLSMGVSHEISWNQYGCSMMQHWIVESL